MSFLRIIKDRRSYRRFSHKKINKKNFDKILEAGLYAPSPKNRQPWLIYSCKGECKKALLDILESKLLQLKSNSENFGSLPISIKAIKESSELLVIYNRYSAKEPDYNNKRWSADTQSIGASIQNMLLEAESLGINSLWICDLFYAAEEIKKLIDYKNELVAGVVFGYRSQVPIPLRPRECRKMLVKELH